MRLLLSSVAAMMMHDSDWVSRSALLDALQESDLRLPPGQFRQAINRLTEKDIVEEHTPPAGESEFRIRVRLYWQWLRRWKPLENVAIEYRYSA